MEIRLFATLRENRAPIVSVPWHEGMDGHALFRSLDIKKEDVAVFLVNGKHSKADTMLNADDIIALFPPVGGG